MRSRALALWRADVECRQVLVGPQPHSPASVVLGEALAEALVLARDPLRAEPDAVDRARDAHGSPPSQARGLALDEPGPCWRQASGISDARVDAAGAIEPAHVLVQDIRLEQVFARL